MCGECRKIVYKYSDIPFVSGSDIYVDWILRNVWLPSFDRFLTKPQHNKIIKNHQDYFIIYFRICTMTLLGRSIGIHHNYYYYPYSNVWCHILLLLLMLMLLNIAYQTNHSFMCYWLDTNSNRRHTYMQCSLPIQSSKNSL